MKSKIEKSVRICIDWIKHQMSSFDFAFWGIYERIRIDVNQRVCCVRPDCNAEFLNVLELHENLNGQNKEPYYTNIFSWLESVQNTEQGKEGSFYFYFLDGAYKDEFSKLIYQNDNGKVLYNLAQIFERTKDAKILPIMTALAQFWIDRQTEEGYFYDKSVERMHPDCRGACFVVWLMVGLYKLWAITQDERYYVAANKALRYCLDALVLEDRIRTSYEIDKCEDWRPYSSEVAIMLLGVVEAFHYEKEETFKSKLQKISAFLGKTLLEMQHKSGAILNQGSKTMEGLTLQEGGGLADLVYTEGFALCALVRAYETLKEEKYLNAAKNLSNFLMEIQCKGESPYWDGAWRGSYDVEKGCWAGRCNQNNQIDEGGMYSVYTGWCCTNIMIGLLQLEKYCE